MIPNPTPPGQAPPNRYPQIYGFVGTFLPLATIAITLRIISRLRFSRIGYDDIASCIAYIFFLGLVVNDLISIQYGFGRHIWEIKSLNQAISVQKSAFTSITIYPAAQCFVKISALFFLLRVLPSTSPWRKRIQRFAAFIVVQETVFALVLLLQCWPVSHFWNKMENGTCINQVAFYYVDASMNIVTDLLILMIPGLIFSSLHIERRKKNAIIAICSAGVFTLVTSIIRLPFLRVLSVSQDPTWTAVDGASWTIAELGSAITTTSVPTLKPLVSWIFPKFTLTSAGDSRGVSKSSANRSSTFALSNIGSGSHGPVRRYEEIEKSKSGHAFETAIGDGESEEYILNDGQIVIRRSIEMHVTSGTTDDVSREA